MPVQSANDKGVQTLSFVVTGTIALFAAVVVGNTAIAVVIARRREFGQQRLIGIIPRQVRRTVALESAVTAATGLLFGTLSAAIGVIPFSIAETHRAIPDVSPGVYLSVATAAVLLTVAASLAAARRTLRVPALACLS